MNQVLSEQDLVRCLQAASCIGTVKMSFESGPYDIDRPSLNASRLYEAIESAILAKLADRLKYAARYRFAFIESPEWTYAVCKWDESDWIPINTADDESALDEAIDAQKGME